ncbi:UNVERIFIED_CONTAM: hypothetical protein RMT77_000289 [Armadillidium vulgare]
MCKFISFAEKMFRSIGLICIFYLCFDLSFCAFIKNEINLKDDGLHLNRSSIKRISNNDSSQMESSSLRDKAEDIYGKLTGIANRLKSETCKCVSLFEECGIEMLEESVLKVRGKACLSNQRFCCEKEEIRMKPETESNLKKLMQSSYVEDDLNSEGDVNFVRNSDKGEINESENQNDRPFSGFNATVNSKIEPEILNLNKTNKEAESNSHIEPETLGAILRLLTEGFKFLSNFF